MKAWLVFYSFLLPEPKTELIWPLKKTQLEHNDVKNNRQLAFHISFTQLPFSTYDFLVHFESMSTYSTKISLQVAVLNS
jgi:hypothetical protein